MDDLTALTAFCEARLAEDEAVAKAALVEWADEDYRYEWEDLPDASYAHGRRHDPARVLREVAAKRAILAEHEVHSEPTRWGDDHSDPAMRGQPTGGTTYWCETCDHDRDYGHIGSSVEGCQTLRILAAAWSDHPDYKPSWAPHRNGVH